MFAIVDRSAAVQVLPRPGQKPLTFATPVLAPGQATVTPSAMRDPNPDPAGGEYTWSIQAGMVLRVTGLDSTGSPATEDVVVQAATATDFTATFTRAYPRGFTSIAAYGNPGPRRTFSPRDYPALVPYFTIIQ
jgi:hypothetical protein